MNMAPAAITFARCPEFSTVPAPTATLSPWSLTMPLMPSVVARNGGDFQHTNPTIDQRVCSLQQSITKITTKNSDKASIKENIKHFVVSQGASIVVRVMTWS